jgi:hypothetical protein
MEALVNFVGGASSSNTKYVLNDVATIQKLKKAASAQKDMEIVDNGKHGRVVKFSTGAYMTVVRALVKDWQDVLASGSYIDENLVDGMKISVVKVHSERDTKNTSTHYLVKLMVDGQEVTVHCYDTKVSMQVQAGAILEPYCTRALFPYLRQEIKENSRRIKEANVIVRTFDSGKSTTRSQAQEQLTRGKSGSPLSTPRRQLQQVDMAASQLLLENVIDDDSIMELISLDEEVVQLEAIPTDLVHLEPVHKEAIQEARQKEEFQGAAIKVAVQVAGPQKVVQVAAPQEVVQVATPQEVVKVAAHQEVVQKVAPQEVVQEAATREVVQEAALQEVVQEVVQGAEPQELDQEAGRKEDVR